MNYFSRILKQTSWQILGKFVTSLSTFIILGLIARNYGQEGTGVFTLALTYLAMFYMLSDFGFNAHELKKGETNWQKLLGTRILWSAVLIILATLLLSILPFNSSNFSKAVLIGVLAIFGSAVFTTCNLIFQKKLRYDLSVFASSAGTISSLLLFMFLVVLRVPIALLITAHLVGWIIIALTSLFLVKRIIWKIFPVFDLKYTINLFKSSWPVAATLALNVVYFRADTFMLAYFKTNSDVGIYNVAYSVFQSALVLPSFIMNSYYPLMLESLSKIKQITLGFLGLSLSGTFVSLLLATTIINILTGGGFNGSVISLKILSLGFPAYFLSALMMWLLITKGKYKSMFVIYTSGLFLNLFLNFLYIPQYSYIAASWITVISEYAILLMQLVVLRSILSR